MAVPVNAIKEANEQILLMHSRMQEMEKQIEELKKTLVEKDQLHVENSKIPLEMQQSVNKKDGEIQELRHKLYTTQGRISNLEQELLDKDVHMEKLQSKSKILDEVVGFRGSLEGLLSYMKIVHEMDRDMSNAIGDINDNLRETAITDGYESEEEQEHAVKTTIVNGRLEQSDNSAVVIDHV